MRLLSFVFLWIGLAAAAPSASAAALETASLPPVQTVAGTQLVANGVGVRTASVFQVPVYAAGLYLPHRTSDAAEILRSHDMWLLELRFLRDVEAENVRGAWVEGFQRTCHGPCQVPEAEMQRFLRSIPPMHKGDVADFAFLADGLHVSLNGTPLGSVPDEAFARLVLAVFVGDAPASPRLKQNLLGLGR